LTFPRALVGSCRSRWGWTRGPSKPRGAPGGFGGQLPDSQRTRSRRKASWPYGTGLEFYVRATVTSVLERGRKGRGGKGSGEQRGDVLVTFLVTLPVSFLRSREGSPEEVAASNGGKASEGREGIPRRCWFREATCGVGAETG